MKKKFEMLGKSLTKDEQKQVSGKGPDHCNGIPCINPSTGQYQCWEVYCYCNQFSYCSYMAPEAY